MSDVLYVKFSLVHKYYEEPKLVQLGAIFEVNKTILLRHYNSERLKLMQRQRKYTKRKKKKWSQFVCHKNLMDLLDESRSSCSMSLNTKIIHKTVKQ